MTHPLLIFYYSLWVNESFLWCVRRRIKLERFMHVRHFTIFMTPNDISNIGGVKVIYPKSRMTSPSIWPTVQRCERTEIPPIKCRTVCRTSNITSFTCRCHKSVLRKYFEKHKQKKCKKIEMHDRIWNW